MLETHWEWILHKGRFWMDGHFRLQEQASVATPPANHVHLYAKDKSGVSTLYYKKDNGTEVEIAAVTLTGSGTTNRLAYWSNSTTLAANAALTQNRLITADSNGLPVSHSALTNGRVLFANSNGLPIDDGGLFWDNTDKRLGIGTTTPVGSIEVKGGTPTFYTCTQASADANAGSFAVNKARGTPASPATTQSGDALGFFSFGGYADGAFRFNTARIEGYAGSLWSATNRESYIVFTTTPAGSVTRAERLRIEASGDISHASGVRHRMLSQNRFRHLNTQAKVFRSTNLTVANNTLTAVGFNSEAFDTDNLHDNSTNNSRITIALGGKYLLIGFGQWAADGTGHRLTGFNKNGSNVAVAKFPPVTEASIGSDVPVFYFDQASAGDYYEMVVRQTSGGDLSLIGGGAGNTYFAAVYLGE